MIIANTRQQARTQSEPRQPDRRICGAASDVLRKGGHVFEPSANLLAIEVYTRPADGDDIQRNSS
jgi:hypothetical protein